MSKVEPGDVVQLNSGGPVMTVSAAGEGGEKCTCLWFAEDKLQTASFPGHVLRKSSAGAGRARRKAFK